MFSSNFIFLNAQDSLFVKYAYAGSLLTIPENEEWTLDKVFINEGNTYSIQINKDNFLKSYTSKDTLMVPYYIAEMELLSNKGMIQYQFYFIKSK